MEISKAQAAKLVLGYLRQANCTAACKEFLRSSVELQEYEKIIKKDKFFSTRVGGLSLLDILNEYSQISILVQGRLEATQFYEANMPKCTLLEQIIYLLDHANEIRTQTPFPFSRCSTPCRPPNNFSPTDSISHEIMHNNVNTTQLRHLPGYSGFEKVIKRKSPPKLISFPEETPVQETLNISNQQKELITQKLLDHQELCEKIAENINSVVRPIAEKQYVSPEKLPVNVTLHKELDAKMQRIIQKTEEDPLFEKLLGEIIGCADSEANKSSEKENESSPLQQYNIELQNNDLNNTSFKNQKPIANEQDSILATVANDAIESLIAVTKNAESINNTINIPKAQPCELNKVLNVNTSSGSGEVIMYNGNIDNYIKTTNTSQPMIFNQNGLLMVQPKPITPATVSNLVSTKSCYIINGQQIMPVQQPAANIFTEQDILSMPTVILNQTQITNPTPTTQYKKIRPKGKQKKVIKRLIPVRAAKVEESNNIIAELPQPEEVPNLPTLSAVTPDLKAQGTKKTTPRSGSHVRQLDFNHSPPKNLLLTQKSPKTQNRACRNIESLQKSPKTSVIQSHAPKVLNSEPTKAELNKGKTEKSWDADLRLLATSGSPKKTPSPKKKKKPKPKKGGKKAGELDDTAETAEKIEMELAKCDELQKPKSATKKTPKSKKSEEKKKDTQEPEHKTQETSSTNAGDLRFGFKNVNAEANIKKKCNIENVKKDIKVLKVKEIKAIDIVMDSSNKMVLSPSKLNASKRSLVSNEITTIRIEDTEDVNKITTPEINKLEQMLYPINAKCNITPMLETPMKMDLQALPKTPCFFSPVNPIDTPFTKVFKEHTQGIDINSIATPQFPLTPSFPITPHIAESGYSNRPTDYSTSSSYYQPSDSEQNKSLEKTIIQECKRLEKMSPMRKRNEVLNNKNKGNETEETPMENEEAVNKSDDNKLEQQQKVEKAISERMKSMKPVIGRKNIQIQKPPIKLNVSNISTSSEDSDSSSSCSSSSSSELGINKTVIESVEKPTTRYSMRLRSKMNTSNEEQLDVSINENSDEIHRILQSVEVKLDEEPVEEQSNSKEQIMKELVEKRKRTLAKIKEPLLSEKKRPPNKKMSINTLKKKPPPKKKKSPVKKVTTKSTKTQKPDNTKANESEEITCDNSRKEVFLHLLSEDEFEEDSNIFQKYKGPCSDDEKSKTSTQEDDLVRGLGQRGIHLIHKKSLENKKEDELLQKEKSQECLYNFNKQLEVEKSDIKDQHTFKKKDDEFLKDKREEKQQKTDKLIEDKEAKQKNTSEHTFLEKNNEFHKDKSQGMPKQTKTSKENAHKFLNDKTKAQQKSTPRDGQSKEIVNQSTHDIMNIIKSIPDLNVEETALPPKQDVTENEANREPTQIKSKGDLEDGEILSDEEKQDRKIPIKKRTLPKTIDKDKKRNQSKSNINKFETNDLKKSNEKIDFMHVKPSHSRDELPEPTLESKMKDVEKWKNSVGNYEKKKSYSKIADRRKSIDHKPTSKVNKEISKQKDSTTDNTNKKETNPKQDMNKMSVLNDLYPEEKSNYDRRSSTTENDRERVRSSTDKKSVDDKNEPESSSHKKNVDERKHRNSPKTSQQKHSEYKSAKDILSSNKKFLQENKISVIESNENISSSNKSNIETKHSSLPDPKHDLVFKKIEDLFDEKDVVSSSKSTISKTSSQNQMYDDITESAAPSTSSKTKNNKNINEASQAEHDDLMTLALIGHNNLSERSKKRKASSSLESEPANKKSNIDILQRVDVDSFLKQLHGN